MARLRKVKTEMSVESDLTPLIDCIFLLLIFLICTTEITKSVNDQLLVLPYASKAIPDDTPKERIVINVYPDDDIIHEIESGGPDAPSKAVVTIEGKGYDWAGLQKYLEQRSKAATNKSEAAAAGGRELVDMPVKIRGHRTTPFKLVQFTMVYCIDTAFWKISFGTFNPRDFVTPDSKGFPGYKEEIKMFFPPYIKRIMDQKAIDEINQRN